MTAPEPQLGPETAREYVDELLDAAERNRLAREAEADLGHDYDGPELRSGTPEHEALHAEYLEWAEPAPEPEAEL